MYCCRSDERVFFWNSVELSKPGSAHPLAQQRECQPPAVLRTKALHLETAETAWNPLLLSQSIVQHHLPESNFCKVGVIADCIISGSFQWPKVPPDQKYKLENGMNNSDMNWPNN